MDGSAIALAGDDYRGDDAVRVAEDEVAVDLAPLVAGGWLAQVVSVPVDLRAAGPVFLADVGSLLPFLVAHVLLVLVVVVIILGEGDASGKSEGEGGNSKSADD
jgi:hypothetical protein